MDKLLIQNARVYQDGHFITADVLCVDALIAKIGQNLEAEDAQVIDAGGMRLAPGLIDVHTHGAAGVDVNAADEAGLRKIAAFFATQGVTAFHASVLTDTPETHRRVSGRDCQRHARPRHGRAAFGRTSGRPVPREGIQGRDARASAPRRATRTFCATIRTSSRA